MAGPLLIFISYSHENLAEVERLQNDLRLAGARIWIDHESLDPGTPDWDEAIRKGILAATFVIYAASVEARKSPYVRDEINLARRKGQEVIPFWVADEDWEDCAPLGWGSTQAIDGRGANYPTGLARLLRRLSLAATPSSTSTASPLPTRETPQPAARPIATQAATDRVAPQPAPPRRSYPLPDVPARLTSLGFCGINPAGTPAILPPLVSVAAGPFLMGSADSDIEAGNDEKSQHRVELAAFQIGKYPVTVAEYALAVRAGAVRHPPTRAALVKLGGPYHETTWKGQLQHPDHPVVCVSWQDATAYVAWLRGVTGEAGWRLPSEAQWEKAARWDAQRGVSRIYPWGDTYDTARCNAENRIGRTTPVGAYGPDDPEPDGSRRSGASPCGAEDMSGNVWEWTASAYAADYSKSELQAAKESTESRTLRGGSWGVSARVARAACRNRNDPVVVGNVIGFRVALAALVHST